MIEQNYRRSGRGKGAGASKKGSIIPSSYLRPSIPIYTIPYVPVNQGNTQAQTDQRRNHC